MSILIVNNGTTYLKDLLSLASAHNFIEVESVNDIDEDRLNMFNAIILSGGSAPVLTNPDLYYKEIKLIKSHDHILGICLGFELIAKTFGAELARYEAKEVGLNSIEKVADDPIFTDVAKIEVFENHRWVVDKLSPDLVGLGKSPSGFEIVRHKDKLIYGFQFHPEVFPDKTTGFKLFTNFLNIVSC